MTAKVRLTRIPIGSNIYPHFDEKRDGAKFHLETFPYKGNYTGRIAVKDTQWVTRLYTALQENWAEGVEGYVETF